MKGLRQDRLTASIMYIFEIMTQKTRLSCEIVEEKAQRFRALAKSGGLTPTDLLRRAVDAYLDDAPEDAKPVGTSRREAKVTVRLDDACMANLDADAAQMGVTPSTWAATILMAKFREAPQPTKPERAAIQKAFRQLFGMGTNINQMALAMNRGLLRGRSVLPTLDELMKLRQQLEQLEDQLAEYAAGKFKVQIKGTGDNE